MLSKFFFKTGVIVVILAMLNGCQKKTVTMEYDQSRNFRKYKLAKYVDDGYSHHENKITANKGFFLIYNICSLTNDDADAVTFNFDLSKFYVVYNGKRYYHTPLQREQFSVGNSGEVHYSVLDQWQDVFKNEVQTAPDKKTIPPHLENILSVSWRFHIWIGDAVWVNEFETKRFDLRYDNSEGGESYLLIARGHDPEYVAHRDTEKDDLALSCRAQK